MFPGRDRQGREGQKISRFLQTTTSSCQTMATNSEEKELSKYVTLVSGDGFEFVVLREAACVSGAIRRMLDPKSLPVPSLQSRYLILRKVVNHVQHR